MLELSQGYPGVYGPIGGDDLTTGFQPAYTSDRVGWNAFDGYYLIPSGVVISLDAARALYLADGNDLPAEDPGEIVCITAPCPGDAIDRRRPIWPWLLLAAMLIGSR